MTDPPQWSRPALRPAERLAVASGAALVDQTDPSFRLRTRDGASELTTASARRLQGLLNRSERQALAHIIEHCVVDTTRWMIAKDGVLVSESRYLVHEKNLARSFAPLASSPHESVEREGTWVIGANWEVKNYWHWHAQVLPGIMHSLRVLEPRERQSVRIATNDLTPWQRDGLAAVGIRESQLHQFPRNKTVRFSRVIYSDLLSSAHVFAMNDVKVAVRERIRQHFSEETSRPAGGDKFKIYISRRDSPRRPLLNETDLEVAMRDLGFSVVVNSSLSFSEQVALFQRADIVVAPHGAGSTNVIFQDPGSVFVEFQQASHLNCGPLSLGKLSRVEAYLGVYPDDGLGQQTEGWEVDVSDAAALVSSAMRQSA